MQALPRGISFTRKMVFQLPCLCRDANSEACQEMEMAKCRTFAIREDVATVRYRRGTDDGPFAEPSHAVADSQSLRLREMVRVTHYPPEREGLRDGRRPRSPDSSREAVNTTVWRLVQVWRDRGVTNSVSFFAPQGAFCPSAILGLKAPRPPESKRRSVPWLGPR